MRAGVLLSEIDGDHGNLVTERLETEGFAFFASTLEFGQSTDEQAIS